jgi:tRNA-dihydrouridine synthase A
MLVLSSNGLYRPVQHEAFAVAPMLGHTNRHWHHFFRLLSDHAHLYTEMIPAAQFVQASQLLDEHDFHREFAPHGDGAAITLQLGGHRREVLAQAAALGARLGYRAINLNCGCPSAAVSGGGRAGGAALMREPTHVADCCAAMLEAITTSAATQGSSHPPSSLTVKMRLGVADASTFDVAADVAAGDGPAIDSASTFIDAVSAAGVTRLQVHGRLALLGEFGNNAAAGIDQPPALWVPPTSGSDAASQRARASVPSRKVDHKREQYKAKQRARQATLANRAVPPLRLSAVRRLASERYPELQLVANGGLDSLVAVEQELGLGMHGGMVGRAAINHPCAFAAADRLWRAKPRPPRTRGEVLELYGAYCDRVEAEAARAASASASVSSMAPAAPEKLIAPVFNLFAGVEGSERYQRRLRRIQRRGLSRQVPPESQASALLRAAAAELSAEALAMEVTDAVPVSELVTYEHATKRAGPLQRQIH